MERENSMQDNNSKNEKGQNKQSGNKQHQGVEITMHWKCPCIESCDLGLAKIGEQTKHRDLCSDWDNIHQT
jgi:hypothetical protein